MTQTRTQAAAQTATSMTSLFSQQPRRFDLVSLGRVGMDLYAQQAGQPLCDVRGFDKSVGGSPGNVAIGAQRLGAKTAMISVLSDDMIGHSVRAMLQREGVDTRAIRNDASGVRTSLAIAEQRNTDCEVVIYRHQAADLALSPADVPKDLIEQARLLLVSGTALSQSPSREAALLAIDTANRVGTPVALDLDYRPYSWQSTEEAGLYLRLAAQQSTLIFGNREEFLVLDAGQTEVSVQQWLFAQTRPQWVFFKDGAKGSVAIGREGARVVQPSFLVNAKKPYGAGDAYAAAICASVLAGLSLEVALERGAAAAAIVVAHTHCALSSPNVAELEHFLQQHAKPRSEHHATAPASL